MLKSSFVKPICAASLSLTLLLTACAPQTPTGSKSETALSTHQQTLINTSHNSERRTAVYPGPDWLKGDFLDLPHPQKNTQDRDVFNFDIKQALSCQKAWYWNLSYKPAGCTINLEVYENGVLISNMPNASVGYYEIPYACECGTSHMEAYATFIGTPDNPSACGAVGRFLRGTDTVTVTCPSPSPSPSASSGGGGNPSPSPSPSATATPSASSSPSASPSPSPSTSPSDGGEEEDECSNQPLIFPGELNNVMAAVDELADNQSISDVTQASAQRDLQIDQLGRLNGQLADELMAPVPNQNLIGQISNQIQDAQQTVNQLENDIQASLGIMDSKRSTLRAELNTLVEDPSFSVDTLFSGQSLDDFKGKLNELQVQFVEQYSQYNTYGLKDAANTLAHEQQLLKSVILFHLSEDFSAQSMDEEVITHDINNLDNINDVIHYLSTSVIEHGSILVQAHQDAAQSLDLEIKDIGVSIGQNQHEWELWEADWIREFGALPDDFSTLSLNSGNEFSILNDFDPGEVKLAGYSAQVEGLAFRARAGLKTTKSTLDNIAGQLNQIAPKIEQLQIKKQQKTIQPAETKELQNLLNEKSQLLNQQKKMIDRQNSGQKVLDGTIKDSKAIDAAKKPCGSCHKYSGMKVSDILKLKQGGITKAPLKEGSPGWDSIRNLTWEQLKGKAKTNSYYDEFIKLLGQGRFDKGSGYKKQGKG